MPHLGGVDAGRVGRPAQARACRDDWLRHFISIHGGTGGATDLLHAAVIEAVQEWLGRWDHDWGS